MLPSAELTTDPLHSNHPILVLVIMRVAACAVLEAHATEMSCVNSPLVIAIATG